MSKNPFVFVQEAHKFLLNFVVGAYHKMILLYRRNSEVKQQQIF